MSKKVLIVDDDRIVLSSCKRALESAGFLVQTAQNFEEFQKQIASEFDIFLIDLKMPVRDGISLIQEIRRMRPDSTIVAMSGYVTEETIEESFEAGASSFLGKPFTPDELLQSIKKALKEEKA
ncbi:MAG: response regulator [Nitrososphaerota archaeon]